MVKNMKIKFDSDNELPLKKTLKLRNIIVIRHSVQWGINSLLF